MTSDTLRNELELRRRHVLNQIDGLVDDSLYGRFNQRRRHELVDCIERLLQGADDALLREFEKVRAARTRAAPLS